MLNGRDGEKRRVRRDQCDVDRLRNREPNFQVVHDLLNSFALAGGAHWRGRERTERDTQRCHTRTAESIQHRMHSGESDLSVTRSRWHHPRKIARGNVAEEVRMNLIKRLTWSAVFAAAVSLSVTAYAQQPSPN